MCSGPTPPKKNPGYAHAMLDENKDVNQCCFIADETIKKPSGRLNFY